MNSYTFHITLYGLAFTGAIFIGLAFAVLLFFTQTINRSANRFLALALGTMIVWMVRVLAIDLKLETYLPRWDWVPMQFLLALGPLMYFYVLKITRPQYKFRWWDLLHFTPVVLELAALLLEIRESAKTGAATYATHTFQVVNPALQLLVFISIITYLHQCNKLINNFYRGLQPVLMDRPLVEFRWLRRLLAATALLWFLWILCAAVYYFGYHNQSGLHVYYPFYIFFVVIIIWTAMAAFLRPQAAVIAQAAAPGKPPVPPELRAKGAWLKRAMEANLYYQDPETSLSSLAEKIGMPPHELSRVINTVFKKGFNDFINEYRVRDAISKIKDPAYDNMTLLGIAFESGFNSQSTFNRIFKQLTGKSATEFKNSLKKEHPSYNLSNPPGLARVISNQQATPKWAEMKLNRNYMFRNYLKVAWRNITRNKTFSFINITGLALGMACSMLILIWVQNEVSYDSFHQKAADIYRVIADDRGQEYPLAGAPLAAALQAQIPNVQTTVRIKTNPTALLIVGNRKFEENRVIYADSTFFQVFSFPLVAGDSKTALKQPDGIFLTESTAKKYFGSAYAIGKTVRMNNADNFTVTGVLKDIPANSHLQFDILLPMSYRARRDSNIIKGDWQNLGFYTYILLNKDGNRSAASIAGIEGQMNHIYKKAAPDFLATFRLQPLTEAHLHSSDLILDIGGHGNLQYVRIFTFIAIFILLVACINFMNLTTARSARRAKEVGLRKVIGALRAQLIGQFLTESLLITFFAILLAVGIVLLILPLFDSLFGKHLAVGFGYSSVLLGLLALFVLTSLVSGSYPAFFLSSFNPAKVLKGGPAKQGRNSILFRNGLVVVQFVVSVLLIVGTGVIYSQLQFIQHRNLGYDKENLLYMPMKGDLNHKERIPSLRAEAMDDKNLANTSFVSELPVDPLNGTVGVIWDGKPSDAWPMFSALGVDENFINVFKVTMASGRWFSASRASDTLNYVINEKALHLMGFNVASAVGRPLTVWGHKGTIIGVVKDFNFKPMQQPVEPLVMLGSNTGIGYMVTRAYPGTIPGTIAGMKRIWGKYNASYEFEYGFIDQELAKRYDAEQRMGTLFNYAALLAIFISCLGLTGLAALTAEQRRKEIGIRKVLGANITGILVLLSGGFVRLVLIATVIAAPVAWYLMHRWLEGFAYQVTVSAWYFIGAGGLALLVALVTVSAQTLRAAMANPVKSLRTE